MRKVRSGSNRTVALFIAALFLLCALLPLTHADGESELKTVRVAAEGSDQFLVSDNAGRPVSGYAYEYIETVAAYAGWDVEYVPFRAFTDCVQALLDGEADLFYGVSCAPERAELFLYPDMPMGQEEYYLYCLPDSSVRGADSAEYDGKRIGVTAGTVQLKELETWCAEKGIRPEIVEFEQIPEKEAALRAGQIDLDLEISLMAAEDFSALDRIAVSDYYLAVNTNRPDLVADINRACAKITSIDRLFFEKLEARYFAKKLVSRTMTEDELAWAGAHDTLRIGYMQNYIPFSDTDAAGAPTGIVTDLVPLMLGKIGLDGRLRVEYVGYADNEEMYAALSEGKVDCIFPVFGHLNYAISKGVLFTASVIGITADLAYTGAFSEETVSRIAVNAKNQLQAYYTGYFYPEAEILYCDTIEDCLNAVVSGKAGSTILNGMRTVELLQSGNYTTVSTITLPENAEFSFAVREGDAALLSILNRAIANTDDFAATTLSYKYLSGRAPVTSREFFRENPQYLYGAAAVALLLLLAFVLYKKKRDRQRADKTRAEQIARISGGVSAYIVDPFTGRFRILAQDKYLSGNYPAIEDFRTSISRYILNDVYPLDRKEAAEAISIPAISAQLDEKDEYVYRYRDISKGTPRWYEMRAVRLSEREILYGFSDKTEEIVSELVLDNLSGEYTALYYVNLDTDDYIPYHLVQKTEDIRTYYARSPKFTDLARGFAVGELVYAEDRESLLSFYPSPEAVRESLREMKSRSMLFRRNYGGEYLWTEVSLVKCEAEHEEAHSAIVCFMEKDREVREKAKQLTAAAEADKLMDNLVSFYNAAFIVNMKDGSCECLKFDETMVGGDKSFGSFAELKTFFLSLLSVDDRERMERELDFATIRGRLAAANNYELEYRRCVGTETVWQIVNITAMNDERFAVGFAGKDLEIIQERLEAKRYEEYFALFEADFDTGMLKVVKNLEYYQGVPVGGIVPYTPFIMGIAEKNEGEPATFYRRISDLEYVRCELMTDDKRTYSYKSRFIGNGDTWIDVTTYVILRHADGSPAVFTLGFSKVDALTTARNEVQVQLREAYRQVEEARLAAEKANRSKTSFLFNMSHDIRTPMNAITGFTGMAKKYINNKERVADYLDKIDTSGQQLLALVNQVLEMARIESGKIELEERPVSVREQFDAAVTVLGGQAENNGLEFRCSLTDIRHDRIFADPARMNSVTLNIAGNAMKYTPGGGCIDFALREIPARREGRATFVFSVADNGIGMSEEYLKVLFDPFTREKSSTVSRIQGTGLGMAIVKELVDLMGGTIDVQSEPGKGTRFDITIDFRIDTGEGTTASPEKAKKAVHLAGRRVLLVEDNEMNREIALDILEEEKLKVETAEDGSQAVEMLREKGADYYNFILMDIQMPVMNGYEATKAIRAMYPDVRLPIIALSANAFAEDKAASLAAGMDEHVAKPVDIAKLLEALERFL